MEKEFLREVLVNEGHQEALQFVNNKKLLMELCEINFVEDYLDIITSSLKKNTHKLFENHLVSRTKNYLKFFTHYSPSNTPKKVIEEYSVDIYSNDRDNYVMIYNNKNNELIVGGHITEFLMDFEEIITSKSGNKTIIFQLHDYLVNLFPNMKKINIY